MRIQLSRALTLKGVDKGIKIIRKLIVKEDKMLGKKKKKEKEEEEELEEKEKEEEIEIKKK